MSRWGLGPKVCMHHFGCGMNWIKGYYMIVKVKNETFWFSTYLMEMHSLTSSSFVICLWGETLRSRTILYSEVIAKYVTVPNPDWTIYPPHFSILQAMNKMHCLYANAVMQPSVQHYSCYMAWKTKVHTWRRHCHLCINAPMWREKR